MLKIPAFKHPSNSNLVTTFKQPNVKEALSFLDLDPDYEEKVTTDYLNTLIVETNTAKDTSKWTAGDRRTALWWIFVNIMPDTELTFSYECSHCNSMHIEDVNLIYLDEEITTLNSLPVVSQKMTLDGRAVEVSGQPINGEGSVLLEEYRLDLLEALEAENDQQAESIRAQMKILDAALSIKIEKLNTDEKIELIHSLSIPEMLRLFTFAERVKQELHHGLHTQLTDGKSQVVSPPLLCQSDENKEGVSSRLLINFRSIDFIPTV